jgi:hypothetical protein
MGRFRPGKSTGRRCVGARSATRGYPRRTHTPEVSVIDLVRRLLGIEEGAPTDGPAVDEPAPSAVAATAAATEPAPEPLPGAACPSCGYLIEPPPSRGRLCPACRQPIVVRQIDGRPAYLTEAAVSVFIAERDRQAEESALDAERKRWLRLAATVDAPVAKHSKLAMAPQSAHVVEASRALYTSAAERAVIKARREKRWADVARIRRAQAAAIYAASGSPVPPPDDAVELHREAMVALLRSFGTQGTGAELVSAGCCKACRADDGKVFRVTQELVERRLPHAGCPHGICACDWWIGVVERKRRRRSASPPAPG